LHVDPLHHGQRSPVPDRARHHRLHPQNVEGEFQPGPPDLGRVPMAPELAAQSPAELTDGRIMEGNGVFAHRKKDLDISNGPGAGTYRYSQIRAVRPGRFLTEPHSTD
jgi:hypothetical protein